MKPDRKKLIRLAYDKPELRKALMPLLKEAAGMDVELDIANFPGLGSQFLITDAGTPSDHGGSREFLHEIRSTQSEGHIIVKGRALPKGTRIRVTRLKDKPRGHDFVGKASIQII